MKILTLIYILLSSFLFSQEEKKEQPKSGDKFFFTLKNAWTTYIPVEARNMRTANQLLNGDNNTFNFYDTRDNLRNNMSEINPFSFTYFNSSRNLFFEFSRYKLILGDAYVSREDFLKNYPLTINSQFLLREFNLPNLSRIENKFDIYKSYSINDSNVIYYGLGLRNIIKSSSKRELIPYVTETVEKYNTYGFNLYFKYLLKVTDNIKFNFFLQPFYTYGSKVNKDPIYLTSDYSLIMLSGFVGYFDYYKVTVRDSNQKAYFYGFELDLSFSYQINENIDLSFGGNLIYNKIRYQNNGSLTFAVNPSTLRYDNNSFFYGQGIQNRNLYPKIYNSEFLYSYYLGVNLKF